MEKYGIKISNYKCFNEPIGFEEIKPINVIIGKNNIGKSSLIDMIEFHYNASKYCDECKKNTNLKLIINKELDENDFGSFSKGYFSSWNSHTVPRLDDYEFARKKLSGKCFCYDYRVMQKSSYGSFTNEASKNYIPNDDFKELDSSHSVQIIKGIKYKQKNVKRLYSERNIIPEKDSSIIQVDGNGIGASNIINKFINKNDLDGSKVQKELLNRLNEIMGDSYNFTNIVVQTIEDKDNLVWEIFLDEENKGRIALSQSGSGLKTIILLLIFTILIPSLEKKTLDNYIFILEELENNLHPTLQRNVIKYIEDLTSTGAVFFITTHSNVFIDSYSDNSIVNLYHLYKIDEQMKLVKVEHSLDKNSILNDVGFKASDILQSNGIIWVEGPSDRIYINKWIELWSNGTLKEGKDYQCVFYGGKLLSHLTFEDDIEELINLLKVNRNSIILIDSDKNSERARINVTKKRIQKECEENNIMCWITKGREIENYVPIEIIKSSLSISKNFKFEKFNDIKQTLNKLESELGEKFEYNKVNFAKRFIKDMTIDNCKKSLDLECRIKKVINLIKEWN